MAGSSTISISFKLDGDGSGFRALAKDSEGLKKALQSTVSEAQKLNTRAINFAAFATGLDQVAKSVMQLNTVMQGLAEAYKVQEVAERQLETVMAQRMGATAQDIQSIKDLASAQQELGVIGDEVQLSGAQQLATFLKQKQSLDVLLPAMNNLLAQQKGLNATNGDAVSIGNLMGKAMQGQTSALRRVGITFTAAQEQVMKYGDESQRAAMLAQIITDNVGNMNAQLAATDAGKQKQLENTLGDVKEQLGKMVSGIMPFMQIAAATTTATTGVIKLASALRLGTAAKTIWNGALKLSDMLLFRVSRASKTTAVATTGLAAAERGATVATRGLSTAVRGLMAATGIGLVITALSVAIEGISGACDDAADSTDHLLSAEERAKKEAEELDAARKQETASIEAGRAALEINIQRTKNFNGTKAEEQKLVNELNDTYGETMGYFSSVSDWYNALIANSQAYCQQLIVEARMRLLADQYAKTQQEIHDIDYNADGSRRTYSKKVVEDKAHGEVLYDKDGDFAGIKYHSDWEIASYNKKQAALKGNSLKKQMEDEAAKAAGIKMPKMGSSVRPTFSTPSNSKGSGSSHATTAAGAGDPEKTRLQEIDEELNKLTQDYVKAGAQARPAINEKITALRAERAEQMLLQQAASRPAEIKTLQDCADELSYLNARRQTATAEELKEIEQKEKAVKEYQEQLEQSAHVPVPADQIKTYKQLNEEIAFCNKMLETADAKSRPFWQKQLNELGKVQDRWDETLEELKKPGEIGALNTLKELEEAQEFYRNKQKKASAEEVVGIQKTINACQRKIDAINRGITLMDMQKEADDINALTGKEYRLKISGMGFDELTSKIKSMQRMLDDAENPVSDTERERIEGLIGVYEKWRRQMVRSFDTYREGFNQLKGVGDGIKDITDAISGNGDAWSKVTGIIEGALRMYDSISGIIGIIDMLTAVTRRSAAAKTQEAAAETEAAAARAAGAAEAPAVVAAATPVIASNLAETASFMKLAAAATFAAHAYIPFVGTAIAEGFIAAQQATLAALNIPKFAEGGIAYGPTLGLFGEYAGASRNPEVVAPLDKLRGMLSTGPGQVVVTGEFRAKGRELVAVVANETRVSGISGKRTNIKI